MARWRFHREVPEEIEAHVRWYERERRDLGAEFVVVLAEVIAELELGPVIASPVPEDRRARRVFVPRFPYAVVFVQIAPEEYLVVAVTHLSRRPGYWLTRLDNET